jgi:hypothetical protein
VPWGPGRRLSRIGRRERWGVLSHRSAGGGRACAGRWRCAHRFWRRTVSALGYDLMWGVCAAGVVRLCCCVIGANVGCCGCFRVGDVRCCSSPAALCNTPESRRGRYTLPIRFEVQGRFTTVRHARDRYQHGANRQHTNCKFVKFVASATPLHLHNVGCSSCLSSRACGCAVRIMCCFWITVRSERQW